MTSRHFNLHDELIGILGLDPSFSYAARCLALCGRISPHSTRPARSDRCVAGGRCRWERRCPFCRWRCGALTWFRWISTPLTTTPAAAAEYEPNTITDDPDLAEDGYVRRATPRSSLRASPAKAGWKAGTGRVAITPKEPMWMAGYAARTKPSEGAVHDLWAKALALEDPAGQRALLVTLDVCGIDRELSNRVRDTLKSRHGLDRDRIVLACSHTHSGPVVGTNLLTMYKIDAEQRRRIAEYAEFLVAAIVSASGQRHRSPGGIASSPGAPAAATSRSTAATTRKPRCPTLRRRLALQGPVDHDVPVLKVTWADGASSRSSSVTPAIARSSISTSSAATTPVLPRSSSRNDHPGAQAMFVAGCGGDQNPIPRRALELAVRLRQAARRQRRRCPPRSARDDRWPDRRQRTKRSRSPSPPCRPKNRSSATPSRTTSTSPAGPGICSKRSRAGASSSRRILIPIEIWRLGGLTWVFLGGEVVVDYSLRIKRNLGSSHTWVSAYCNDVMAYIPSRRVLKEGGYEGGGAMVYYGLPAVWSDEVEEAHHRGGGSTAVRPQARSIDSTESPGSMAAHRRQHARRPDHEPDGHAEQPPTTP